MSTALSWTELRSSREDLGSLLAFRRSGLSRAGRRRMRVVGTVVVLLTLAAVLAPAYLGGETPRPRSGQMLALLPSLCLGFLVLAIFTAVASAGGRELLPRDQAVAFPVSTTTDHFGALLLAPLNIAWIAQSWALLGITAYTLGSRSLLAYELPVLLWILSATALAQVFGWLAEGVRRGPHGIAISRTLLVVLGAGSRRPRRLRLAGPAPGPQPHRTGARHGPGRSGRPLGPLGRRRGHPRPRRGGERRAGVAAGALGAEPPDARGAPPRVGPSPGPRPCPGRTSRCCSGSTGPPCGARSRCVAA